MNTTGHSGQLSKFFMLEQWMWLLVVSEHISLTQKKMGKCGMEQLTSVREEEPWEPNAPVMTDSDSLSRQRKRRILYSL